MFSLHKWESDVEMLESEGMPNPSKILGLKWDKRNDELSVEMPEYPTEIPVTKKSIATILAKSPWDITTFFLCFYILDFMQNYVINPPPPSSLPHSMLKLECAQATFLFNFQH